MDKVRLRLRNGEKEFEAEGPLDDVKARWEEARGWLLQGFEKKEEGSKDQNRSASNQASPPTIEIDRARGTIRLRVLPPGGRILQRVSKALLLLLHGYQCFLEKSPVAVTRLADDLRLSGFANLRRLSRAFGKLESDGFAVRSGRGKGTGYQATTPGLRAAEEILRSLTPPT